VRTGRRLDDGWAPNRERRGRVPATALAWGVPFVLVLTVLLVRDAFLFGTPEHEQADMGADSILIEQARRFTLLVGNYSREHFNHPGPAIPASGPMTDPSLPAGVAAMARAAAGRPAIIAFAHNAWPSITGLLVQAERTGVTACVSAKTWAFMMTGQFICTPAQLANGRKFYVYVPGQVPRGASVVFQLRRGIVTAGGK
jgi:hypothetical protein